MATVKAYMSTGASREQSRCSVHSEEQARAQAAEAEARAILAETEPASVWNGTRVAMRAALAESLSAFLSLDVA